MIRVIVYNCNQKKTKGGSGAAIPAYLNMPNTYNPEDFQGNGTKKNICITLKKGTAVLRRSFFMKVRRMFASAAAVILTVGALAVNTFAADNLLSGEIDLGRGWGGELIPAEAFADIKEGDVVTFEYTINNEDSYHLVQIASGADTWPTLECSTQAVSNQTDAEFRNQDDGFAVVSVDGSVSCTLTAFDVDELGEYGMVIRGYDVTVKSITVGAPAAADSTPEPAADVSGNTGAAADNKGNPDTGVEGVAAVSGVAAVAALAVGLVKKK